MDYRQYVRDQVAEGDWDVLQDLDANLDTDYLASIWDDFVEPRSRLKNEIPFLEDCLEEYEEPKILDASFGSGTTGIALARRGYDVVGNEVDSTYRAIAADKAEERGVDLEVTDKDWRELSNHFGQSFDVIILLGNSLTYLFKKADRMRALREFRKLLGEDGKLIIDERNYADHFLDGDYQYSGEYVYCGDDMVDAHPIHISDSLVVMEYSHVGDDERAHLALYPFDREELRGELEDAGFKDITAFYPYDQDLPRRESEFITYVAYKEEER